MARYIDAVELQRRICGAKCGCEHEECGCEGDCVFEHFIFHSPTADVVPRAEVEKLHEVIFKKEDLMQKIAEERNKYADELEVVKDTNEHLKAEVAREIFEEIESFIKERYNAVDELYCESDEDITDAFYGAKIETYNQVGGFIDELKKKYAEGKDINVPGKKDYYTPEEVRNMSHTEISNNLTVIRESMKRWREK
jgi:hypothetical protein